MSAKIVAVVGGGLSGSLLALKLNQARPDFRILLIEKARRLGRGVAYGACAPQHLLNVPVSRMEVGLTPTFAAWLRTAPRAAEPMASALVESDGDLQSAFAPRFLFGDYMQERVAEALTVGPGPGIAAVRGEAVRLLPAPRRGVRLADGRELDVDLVVLATGNLAPRAPAGPDSWLQDSPRFVADPWASDALAEIGPEDPVLLLGTGLTMVDVALKLDALGHQGNILAISRRGLGPKSHAAGGAWPSFMGASLPASPLRLLRLFREQVAAAEASGVPWQRVFDAARPAVPAAWRSWSLREKRQFLRHLRPRWDVHRHRMAPRIAAALDALVDAGRLTLDAARITACRPWPETAGPLLDVSFRRRSGDESRFRAAWVINCTGPRRELTGLGVPLLADLVERHFASPDALGLGLETENGALLDRAGRVSDWLFAVGPLTCPSWWEIVAVPEISVQVDSLATRLATEDSAPDTRALAPEDFLDLGAGI